MWKLVWNPTVDLRTIWQYDSPTCLSTMVATIVPLIYLPFCSMILPETSMAMASVISRPSAESCRLQHRGRARRSAGGRVPCFNGGNCTETCRRCRQMGAIMALWLATLKKKHVFPGYGWYGVHSFMMYKNESGLLERRWHRDVEVPHHILLWEGAWL